MRGEELLDILEHIDPALIENADRKPKSNWLRWTALAASLALVIGLCAYFGRPPAEKPVTRTPLPMISLVSHTVSPESLTGVQILGSPASGSNKTQSGTQGCPPKFSFDLNLMVEAKAVEVLPDVYTDPVNRGQYHIIRFETMEAIAGRNFPKQFYLRLGIRRSTELAQFDSMILSLEQVGIEDYILLNQSTQTMEAFSLVFDMCSSHWNMYNTAMAFTDGVLDPSLWDLKGWGIGIEEQILAGSSYYRFPAKEGSTPEDVKNYIFEKLEKSEWLQNLRVQTRADFSGDGVADFVKPFENGVFVQSELSDGRVTYTRLINGFHTTENILVTDDGVTYEGEAFSQADLSAVPDLGAMIEKLDLETLEQPHAAYYEGRDVRLHSMGATGKYAKVNGEIYGIVKVTWRYLQNGVYDITISYYDALYYLISADGSCRSASWEELQALLGKDEFLVKPTTPEELERGY